MVIDGAAKIEARTGRLVGESDVCLIPVQPTPFDSWGAEQVIQIVKESGMPAAFLITQQKPRTNLPSEVGEGLEEGYRLPVLDARLSYRVAFAESMFGGHTALDVSGAEKQRKRSKPLEPSSSTSFVPMSDNHFSEDTSKGTNNASSETAE